MSDAAATTARLAADTAVIHAAAMASVLSPRRKWRRAWVWLRWRALLLLIAFLCGFVAFQFGVDVTDRPGIPSTGLLTKVYYTVGLFVLGGLDLGTPVGGPEAARWLLWF